MFDIPAVLAGPALAALLAGPADSPDPAAASEAAPPPAEVLSGPSVDDAETAVPASLVRRDFAGALEPLDAPPAEVALALLDLSAEERARTAALLDERAAAMERVVRANLRNTQLLEAATATPAAAPPHRAAAGRDRIASVQQGVMRSIRDELGDEPLVEQLAAVLAPGHADELRRLVRDYTTAAVAERAAALAEAGEGRSDLGRRIRAGAEHRIDLFRRDVERTLQRIIEGGTRDVDRIVEHLKLTPEQANEVRTILQRFGERTMLDPTERDGVNLYLELRAVLTMEQRAKLLEMWRREK